MSETKQVKYVDHLSEDEPIYGQKFVCLSIVTPTGDQKCDVSGIKIRGAYPTEEDARKRAAYLQKVDPNFNIYVAPMSVWLPICDNPEKVGDVEYQNEQLNDIVKGYKDNQQKQQELFEENKRKMKEEAEKLSSEEYKLERTKLDYSNSLSELSKTKEKISDLEKLISSLKDSLVRDFSFDPDETAEAPAQAQA
jgi:hypothetical protein